VFKTVIIKLNETNQKNNLDSHIFRHMRFGDFLDFKSHINLVIKFTIKTKK